MALISIFESWVLIIFNNLSLSVLGPVSSAMWRSQSSHCFCQWLEGHKVSWAKKIIFRACLSKRHKLMIGCLAKLDDLLWKILWDNRLSIWKIEVTKATQVYEQHCVANPHSFCKAEFGYQPKIKKMIEITWGQTKTSNPSCASPFCKASIKNLGAVLCSFPT